MAVGGARSGGSISQPVGIEESAWDISCSGSSPSVLLIGALSFILRHCGVWTDHGNSPIEMETKFMRIEDGFMID